VTVISKHVSRSSSKPLAKRADESEEPSRRVATDGTAVDAVELDVRVWPGISLLVEVPRPTRRRSGLGGQWIDRRPPTP
jgi:hypothetical protein